MEKNKSLLIGVIMFSVGCYLFYTSAMGFLSGIINLKSFIIGFILFMVGATIILAHFYGWLHKIIF